MTEPILVAALIACFAGAAVLALAEVSIVRVRRTEVAAKAAVRERRAIELLSLLDDLPLVLNSILFAVLLLQVSAATIGAFLAGQWFGGLGVSAASFGLTLVLFVYAEAIPKTLAVKTPYLMAARVAPLLRLLTSVLKPIVGALIAIADLQSPGEGMNLGAFTEREIKAVAAEAAAAGEIDAGDAELVARSFLFNDRSVRQVMVARDDIAAINGFDSVLTGMTAAITAGHRRLPVLGRGLDDVVGVVRLRDLAAASHIRSQTPVRELMSPTLRCAPDARVAALLKEMQFTGRSLAIVVDRNGLTLGLVTIEDLAAELVGEIAEDDPDRGGANSEPGSRSRDLRPFLDQGR